MAIITLAEAKLQLNITSSTHDTEIQTYIDATERMVEEITGRIITPRSFTEDHLLTGSPDSIFLWRRPIQTLTSITAIGTTTTYSVSDVHINSIVGELRTLRGPGFAGRLVIVYTAGMSSIPVNYNLAARIIVQHLWQTQRGTSGPVLAGGLEMGYQSGNGVRSFGFAVPNRALELLGSRSPVVG